MEREFILTNNKDNKKVKYQNLEANIVLSCFSEIYSDLLNKERRFEYFKFSKELDKILLDKNSLDKSILELKQKYKKLYEQEKRINNNYEISKL